MCHTYILKWYEEVEQDRKRWQVEKYVSLLGVVVREDVYECDDDEENEKRVEKKSWTKATF